MSFSKTYGKVIRPFIRKFKEGKNKKLRDAVVLNAAESVRKYRENLEEKGEELPKEEKELRKVRLDFFLFFYSMFLQPMFISLDSCPIYQEMHKG
jgi:hypothetical protein